MKIISSHDSFDVNTQVVITVVYLESLTGIVSTCLQILIINSAFLYLLTASLRVKPFLLPF